MRILVLNGPNLNMLSQREPGIYGTMSLGELEATLRKKARELGVDIETSQSNSEGALIDMLQRAKNRCAGVIFNPGGYTHTSVAIRDAIAAMGIPVVEVHISNIHARETFRQVCVTTGVCAGQVSGMGVLGYFIALQAVVQIIKHPAGGRTDDTQVEDRDRGRRNRRGRRGGRRRRDDEDVDGNEEDSNSLRQEDQIDPSERYAGIEGVTVRKGLDVLAEAGEKKPRKAPRGRVSFGGEEDTRSDEDIDAGKGGSVVRKRSVRRSSAKDSDGSGDDAEETTDRKAPPKSGKVVRKRVVKKKVVRKKTVGTKPSAKKKEDPAQEDDQD